MPFIIRDLEYVWHELEETRNGNPNGLVDMFLKSINNLGGLS